MKGDTVIRYALGAASFSVIPPSPHVATQTWAAAESVKGALNYVQYAGVLSQGEDAVMLGWDALALRAERVSQSRSRLVG